MTKIAASSYASTRISKGKAQSFGRSTKTRKPGTSISTSTSTRSLTIPRTRVTPTHLFFHGGVLSNWNCGQPYPGSRALSLLLSRLHQNGIPHPSPDSTSTKLLARCMFNCGEQWMMACKAWLFERDLPFGEATLAEEDLTQFVSDMKESTQPKGEWSRARLDFWNGSLVAILDATAPRDQKSLGRKIRNFDPDVWNQANMAVVTSGCLARAEADEELGEVYRTSDKRHFVEGSPKDKIWGVGMGWNDPRIEDEKNWKGENRLGKCHDEARDMYMAAGPGNQ